MTESFAHHQVPAGSFPFTVEFYKEGTEEKVHEITVTGPGNLHIPGLKEKYGPVSVRITYPGGEVTSSDKKTSWADEPTVLSSRSWGHYQIYIERMLYNHRIQMVRKSDELSIEYAWCYRTKEAALLALAVWDPDVQDEPDGWHKRPGGRIRKAPNRHPDLLVRCDHGVYPGDACDVIGCYRYREDSP